MASSPNITFDIHPDKSLNHLPTADQVIERFREVHRGNLAANVRCFAVATRDGASSVWVKYGWPLMAEARTQQYVAEVVQSSVDAPVRVPAVYFSFQFKHRDFIVMEHIIGETCRYADVGAVATAVQFLITIKAPTDQPGPVGRGEICHDFFVDRQSSVTYSTVALLEDHINGILKHVGRPHRVSLSAEVQTHGLRLCPSDMNITNFLKDGEGKIVAVDFGATCFLPVSFFDLALCHHDNFTQLLRHQLNRPSSTQLDALYIASKSLVPFGTNNIVAREKRQKRKMKLYIVRYYDKQNSWQSIVKERLQDLGVDKKLDEELLTSNQKQKWKTSASKQQCREAYRLALAEMDMENSSTHPTEYSLGGDNADGESET